MTIPLRVLLVLGPERDPAPLLEELRRGGYDPSWRRVDSAGALEQALAEPWEVALCDGGREVSPWAPAILRAHRPEIAFLIVAPDDAGKAAGAAESPVDLTAEVTRILREAEIRNARRRAEEALRESGERFAQAFEHAPIGMNMVGVDGLLLHTNRSFCEMLGYSAEELVGTQVWRFTHPEDMTVTIEQLQRLIEGESDAWLLEKRLFHRDGRTIWVRSSTWLVRGADGVASHVVSQVQDITEPRRLEEQMRQREEELAHALRLASMGEMVAEIAHEINQPLGAIANFAHGLVRRPDDVEATRATAARIASEALRAAEVIRRLRGFLRRGEAKRERCDASDLVRDSVRLMEVEIRRHAISVSLELAADPLPVQVHRVQVGQVVHNLLRNAVEAMAKTERAGRRLIVRTAAGEGETVLVSIADTGLGLPCEEGDRIFDAFFTTKAEGLGLGLSISRSIVEAHGGELSARPNPGRGSTVAFSLPTAAPARRTARVALFRSRG